MSGPIAVFDLGKTNSKMLVFSAQGHVLETVRTRPQWSNCASKRVLDDAALEDWMRTQLSKAIATHSVERMMVSGHGCTFALVDERALTHPILDYEQEPPEDIAAQIDQEIPEFSETYSPKLPLGFNFGRHMLWLNAVCPAAFANASAILGYPQYWGWRFSGKAVSEVSYLGCHSHLWAPLRGKFSSLVNAKGWHAKMPECVPAGAELGELAEGQGGKGVVVHNGVHDSNAALHCYRASGHEDFTLVSTGTWVIIFNPSCRLEALDEHRDMLANVRVDGKPVPTIRFMGGREFDAVRAQAAPVVTRKALEAVISRGVMALPSFAPGGPFAGQAGEIHGTIESDQERAAVALLYVALMTDFSLDLIASHNTIIVDGGLARIDAFLGVLAQLRQTQKVLGSDNPEGSALGAAMLAYESIGVSLPDVACKAVLPIALDGLSSYRAQWRDLVGDRQEQASMPVRRMGT